MNSEASLNRTVLAVTSLGRWEFFVHLLCFLFYIDALLALGKGVTISDLSFEWIRVNLSLGVALLVLVSYAFIRSFLLPIVDAINLLIFARAIESKRRDLPEDQIDALSWLAYSILTRNSPAYREIDWIRQKNENREERAANCRHLCLFFLANITLGIVAGRSVTFDLLMISKHWPPSQRFILWGSALLVFLAFGLYALLAPLTMRLSVWVENKTLRTEVKETLKFRERLEEAPIEKCDGLCDLGDDVVLKASGIQEDEGFAANRVGGGFSPPPPTPPSMRVRTGRFTEDS